MLSDRHEDITNLHAQLASSRSRYNTHTACTSAPCSLLASASHAQCMKHTYISSMMDDLLFMTGFGSQFCPSGFNSWTSWLCNHTDTQWAPCRALWCLCMPTYRHEPEAMLPIQIACHGEQRLLKICVTDACSRTLGIKTTMTCCYSRPKAPQLCLPAHLCFKAHEHTESAQQRASSAQCCRGLVRSHNALTGCRLLCRVAELELLRGHERSEHDKLDRLEVCTQSLVKGLQLERDMVALCLHKSACSCES